MPERKDQENDWVDNQFGRSLDFDKSERTSLQGYDVLKEVRKIIDKKWRQNFIDLMNA